MTKGQMGVLEALLIMMVGGVIGTIRHRVEDTLFQNVTNEIMAGVFSAVVVYWVFRFYNKLKKDKE